MRATRLLSTALGVDALLLMGFGVASWLSPRSTYGTIVDLGGAAAESPVTMAALSQLSVFYVLLGMVCLCGIFLPPVHASRLAVVMVLRHAWIGVTGYLDADQEWIVGNPWPDIVIHAAFVLLYSSSVWRLRGRSAILSPPAGP